MKPNLFSLPFDEFRSDGVDQKQAIIRLLQTETPYVSLIAPPGAGKTAIALAYGEVMGRTLFLTPTKHLHTQLEDYGVFSLHGHSHYSCWENGECRNSDDCEHSRKMKLAKTKNRVGTTYANWIGLNRRGLDLGRFDLIVCDEAHNLPWIIADQMTFTLSKEWCDNFEPSDGLLSTREFLRSLVPKLGNIRDTNKEVNSIERFLIDSSMNPYWLCETDDKNGLTCRVIWSNRFSRHVFVDCRKVLLMSATLSYQTLKYLSVELGENTFIELETNFDPSLNPFIAVPVVAVQYNMSPQDCDKLVEFIDLVIQTRTTQGIIHSVSYQYAQIISQKSQYAREMIYHWSSSSLPDAIDMFLRRKGKVLVSPSLSEGVDLVGDTCRWQIPIKIPTLNKMDMLTATRCAQDRAYEPFLMANQIQQQHGRGRRSITDWCESLMPDIYWQKFYQRNRQFFMKWFRDTVRTASMLPAPLRQRRKSI